jgi:hypothetical protein
MWPARWFGTQDRSLLPGWQGSLCALTPGFWILPDNSRLRSRTAGNPNGAICAEPPTLMVQESGIPIRQLAAPISPGSAAQE